MREAMKGALESGVTREEQMRAENQRNEVLKERDNSDKQID